MSDLPTKQIWCSVHECTWPPITVFGRCTMSMFKDSDVPCDKLDVSLVFSDDLVAKEE